MTVLETRDINRKPKISAFFGERTISWPKARRSEFPGLRLSATGNRYLAIDRMRQKT